MPRKVNIVLPDGTVTSVDEAVAEKLTSSGQVSYEKRSEGLARGVQQEQNERFSGAFDKVKAGLEGVASTLSLGLSDELGGLGTQARAQANPGSRLLGEVAGAFVPGAGVLGSAGKAAKLYTPAGAAMRGAEALGALAGKAGSLKRMAVTGAAEGAAFGLGGAVSRAALSDDPLTIEAASSGIRGGALLGFGIGAVAGGVSRIGAKARKTSEAAMEAAATDRADGLSKWTSPEFEGAIGELKLARKGAQDVVEAASSAGLREDISRLNKQFDAKRSEIAAELSSWERVTPEIEKNMELLKQSKLYGNEARKAKTSADAFAALNKQSELLAAASDGAFSHTEIMTTSRAADDATHRLATMSIPSTMREFSAMRPEHAADLINGLKATQHPAAQRALAAFEEAALSAGIKGKDVVDSLNGLHAAMRETSLSSKAASGSKSGLSKWADRTGRMAGTRIARKMAKGVGEPAQSAVAVGGGMLGSWAVGGPLGLVSEVMGLRVGLQNRVRNIITKYGEKLGHGVADLVPASDRLRYSIFGDEEDGDIRDLAVKRIEETYRMAPAARDAAYAAASPMASEGGTPFALGLANHLSINAIKLAGRMPKDPGTAMVMGKSDWRPSIDQVEAMSGILEAAEDPWASIERQLAGEGDPEAVNTLWDHWPATMQELQLETAVNAAALSELPYEKVLTLSAVLRTPLDGLLIPGNVAALQHTFIPGNNQQQGGGSSKATGGASGRPPASTPPTGGTMVQNLTR